MPYKDPEKKRAYDKRYRKTLTAMGFPQGLHPEAHKRIKERQNSYCKAHPAAHRKAQKKYEKILGGDARTPQAMVIIAERKEAMLAKKKQLAKLFAEGKL